LELYDELIAAVLGARRMAAGLAVCVSSGAGGDKNIDWM
jgi:hypothetical protein